MNFMIQVLASIFTKRPYREPTSAREREQLEQMRVRMAARFRDWRP